jgi:two-component system alkaline phosphatase synthesis response regulator PhoP
MTRILVVEDEPGIALGLEDDLRLEGWDVELIGDGIAAARRAKESAFDLILLDVMLPGKDGLEVCRELRRSGLRTPIIMLTAKAQEAEKILGLDLGADDYITKPFSPKELRARIRAALRRNTPVEAPPPVFRFGDAEVDEVRCELRRAGTVVEMTPTEFKLLSVFVHHRGRVLSREKLLDEAWGRGTFLTDRVVDNHIVALRKKIEPEPADPRYLVSVRGIGYRFDG